MTGWRIGYTAGPAELITTMARVQSQTTSNPAAVSQVAAQAALTGPQACVADMRKAFGERRDFVVETLKTFEGAHFPVPDGAFYVFADLSAYLGRTPAGKDKPIDSDMDLAEYLISTVQVATVPGSAFGAPGCIRLSYAASEKRLAEGLKRMKSALNDLK
jgi:aspartate aminotransferase